MLSHINCRITEPMYVTAEEEPHFMGNCFCITVEGSDAPADFLTSPTSSNPEHSDEQSRVSTLYRRTPVKVNFSTSWSVNSYIKGQVSISL
jgi:hypothetical protein